MYLTTSYQTFVGHTVPLNDLANFPMNSHGSSPRSVPRDEEAAPTNSRSVGQGLEGHHPINASNQGVPAGRKLNRFLCQVCDVSFAQRQGLNRHRKDKHKPRKICRHCGIFEWSSARQYLFTRHLKKCRPGVGCKTPSPRARNDSAPDAPRDLQGP